MNKSFNPKVSIVIPVYNGSDFLAGAIDSALAQTYGNIGMWLSTTVPMMQERLNELHCLTVIKSGITKTNGGVASALNVAIDKMTGEYFSWLSHDDLYVKEKIESQINALALMPSMNRCETIVLQ